MAAPASPGPAVTDRLGGLNESDETPVGLGDGGGHFGSDQVTLGKLALDVGDPAGFLSCGLCGGFLCDLGSQQLHLGGGCPDRAFQPLDPPLEPGGLRVVIAQQRLVTLLAERLDLNLQVRQRLLGRLQQLGRGLARGLGHAAAPKGTKRTRPAGRPCVFSREPVPNPRTAGALSARPWPQ
jgi:hypothetical protein